MPRTTGRIWTDDQGLFRPCGGTLFWALSGYRDEHDRVMENVGWLAAHGITYLRILGTFERISASAPDYLQNFAGFIDEAYDKYGMRTSITCHGGGNIDHRDLANKVVSVVSPRAHKVLNIECINEMYSTWPGHGQQMKEMAEILHRLPHLIAGSSPPDPQREQLEAMMRSGPYNYGTIHGQRSNNDLQWKFVRQNWDFQSLPWAIDANEPQGPGSSVAECRDPLRLAMDRALGILCGKGAYVLHNANGIYGYANTNPHGGMVRQANVWECPDADAIYDVVTKVHTIIPDGVENWTNANDGWTPPNPVHPLPSVAFWGDGIGFDHGVNKNYSGLSGDGRFVCMPCGVLNYADLQARQAMHVRVYQSLTRQLVHESDLNSGELLRLQGDPSANAAYVIQGELR